jgi:hypothetical protein
MNGKTILFPPIAFPSPHFRATNLYYTPSPVGYEHYANYNYGNDYASNVNHIDNKIASEESNPVSELPEQTYSMQGHKFGNVQVVLSEEAIAMFANQEKRRSESRLLL